MKRLIYASTSMDISLNQFRQDCVQCLNTYIINRSKDNLQLLDVRTGVDLYSDTQKYYKVYASIYKEGHKSAVGLFSCMYLDGHVVIMSLTDYDDLTGNPIHFIDLGELKLGYKLSLNPVDINFGNSVQEVFQSQRKEIEDYLQYVHDLVE